MKRKRPRRGACEPLKLPPHLQFVHELSKPWPEDADEANERLHHLISQVKAHEAELNQHGWNATKFLAQVAPQINEAEEANREVDALQEKLLQATANLADRTHALFKQVEPIIQAAYEANPFDPEIQELKEFIEEWRQELPKE